MDKTQIEGKIRERAMLNIQKAELAAQYDKWAMEALPPEVQERLKQLEQERNALLDQVAGIQADLAAEKETAMKNANEKVAQVEEEIKVAIVALKETVKVEGVASCIYNKGKVSWNTDALEKLMVQEGKEYLKALRTDGNPYAYFK